MQEEKRPILIGILGTVAFHLLLLVIFLAFRINKVRTKHKEQIVIEFAQENYKPIEQIIKESKPKNSDIPKLSNQALKNIASNTEEKLNDKISTEKYIDDVMKELDIKDLHPKYDNTLPNEANVQQEQKQQGKKADNKTYNFGPSRVSYDISDKRGARHIERPIYKCEGGGTVIVGIAIDQSGQVIESKIEKSTVEDNCLIDAALNSAKSSYFQSNYNSPKRVEGTITYMFVAQ